MKIIISTIIEIVALYALFLLFVYFFAEKIIFPAPEPSYGDNGEFDFIEFDCDGKQRVAVLYLPAKDSEYTLIYSHGNGEDLGEIRPVLENLRASGLSVIAYDYVGYGLSKGKPTVKNLLAAADAVWKYAVEDRKIPPDKIALMGYSLGSAPTSHLAAAHDGQIRAVVLSGAFSHGVNAIIPVNIVPWKILDNASLLKGVKTPIMLIHGKKDRIVPFRNFKELSATCAAGTKKIIQPEFGHTNISQSPDYFRIISNFVKNPKQ